MNKYLKFAKNVGIASVGFVIGGYIGSELSDLVYDSETWISVGSTIGEVLLGYLTMFTFHARDNQDLYRDRENEFRVKEFVKDCGKIVVGLSVLDCSYFVGRTYLHYRFQKEGYSPVEAYLLADAICIPAFCAAAIPMGRFIGVIRENKDE